MISVIYRTEVEVPELVFQHLGHTSTYDRDVIAATRGAATSGQDAYSHVCVWAEDSDRQVIEQIDRRLHELFAEWLKKLS